MAVKEASKAVGGRARPARRRASGCWPRPTSCSTTRACTRSASTASSSRPAWPRPPVQHVRQQGRAGPGLPPDPPRQRHPAHHGGGGTLRHPARAPAGRVRRPGGAVRPAGLPRLRVRPGQRGIPARRPGRAGHRGLPPLGAHAADRAGRPGRRARAPRSWPASCTCSTTAAGSPRGWTTTPPRPPRPAPPRPSCSTRPWADHPCRSTSGTRRRWTRCALRSAAGGPEAHSASVS